MSEPEHPFPDPGGDVSVAIVLYRTPAVVAECLTSFEEHRPRRVAEVIVVDNSTDGSGAGLAERFAWIDYVENLENVHYRRANNQAARRASGTYLLLLNPDTRLVDGDSVARLADVLDEQPGVGLVGPMLRGDDGLLAPQGERLAGLRELTGRRGAGASPTDADAHRPRAVDTLTAAALMCRRSEFLAVGGFDERARMYWEEHELARKLQQLGLQAFYEPHAFVYHRWRKGGSELATRTSDYFEEARRLYYRHYLGPHGRLAYAAVTVARRLKHRLRGTT